MRAQSKAIMEKYQAEKKVKRVTWLTDAIAMQAGPPLLSHPRPYFLSHARLSHRICDHHPGATTCSLSVCVCVFLRTSIYLIPSPSIIEMPHLYQTWT